MKIITGRAGTGKTKRCFQEICTELQNAADGQALILILPEQATFQAERELAALAGRRGFVRAHVLGFRRLAHRILTETGGGLRPHITDLGKRLVIERILEEQKNSFEIFGRAARQRGFAEVMVNTIKEFKNYDIPPETLQTFRCEGINPVLNKKVHDLAIIYSNFEKFLQGRYTDPEDYLKLLTAKIAQSSLLKGARIWVDGFSWFTPQEYKVLSTLLTVSGQLTVTLSMPPQDTALKLAAFERQNNTRKRLITLAQERHLPSEEEELTTQWRFQQAPLLDHIERQILARPLKKWSQPATGFSLVEAASRRVEIEGVARDIIRLCRDESYRLRDIAVLIRDFAGYRHILENVFNDYGIPFFTDGKRPATHHPVAELLRSALEVLTGRWCYDAVFRCLKTDLFPVSRDSVDILENYVLEFGIRGSRWTNAEPWRFERRISLDTEQAASEEAKTRLELVNAARELVVSPLAALEYKIKQAGTVKAVCSALYEFLLELKTAEKLEEWAMKAEHDGDLVQAREHRQVLTQIGQLLEQIVEAFGDQPLALQDFLGILNEGLEALEINLIPPSLDYVVVSPLERNKLNNARAVYIPGVNDGILPQRNMGEGILSDDERSSLVTFGLELALGSETAAYDEQYLIYSSFSLASNYLWVSFPLADDEGNGLTPSYLIKRLQDITGTAIKALPVEPPVEREMEYIAHPRSSISYLAAALRDYAKHKTISPIWWEVYNWVVSQPEQIIGLRQALGGLFHQNREERLDNMTARRLYCRNNRLFGSVTRFEEFMACPFKHFARYGLKLTERPVFQLRAPDFGQFLHAIVKEFGETLSLRNQEWGTISFAECESLCNEIVAGLVPKLQNEILLSSGQYKHLAERLKHTARKALWRLAEFGQVTSFKPYGYELSFGDEEQGLPALRYRLSDKTELTLAGKIDRLDVAFHAGTPYVLVIDYKSGGSWLKLTDILYGLKLQLLTYLLVVCRGFSAMYPGQTCHPASVVYYFLRRPQLAKSCFIDSDEVLKEINNKMKMPGWILADDTIISLLDSQFIQKSEFFKLARKNDGQFAAASKKYLKTEQEFGALMRHTEQTVVGAAESITAGEVSIRPYSMAGITACDRCVYRPVCQFDVMLAGNDFKTLKQVKDPEVIEIICGKEGDR